jgi:hypothetical protein
MGMPEMKPLERLEETEKQLKGYKRYIASIKVPFKAIKNFFKKWRV